MNDRFVPPVTVEPLTLLPAPIRWRILLPTVLVLTAFVLILTMGKFVAALIPPQADLFASYRTLFPGGAGATMAQYPCTMYAETPTVVFGVQKVMCVLSPEKGFFRQVTVFTTGGKITGINFYMRNVRLVDLIGQWGMPDQLYRVGGTYKVVWKQHFNMTAAIDRRYSMQAPVRLIAITNAPPKAYRPSDSYLCSGKYGNIATKWGCNFPSTLDRH